MLLVARFDRTPDQKRIHYMSAHTLVNINGLSFDQREYKTTYSYAGIAELMRGINDNAMADSHALFRRMVFNIMIGNVDDHMRNHALLMAKPGRFKLSPALTFFLIWMRHLSRSRLEWAQLVRQVPLRILCLNASASNLKEPRPHQLSAKYKKPYLLNGAKYSPIQE